LSVYRQASFITAPSMTTPAVTYFHNATSILLNLLGGPRPVLIPSNLVIPA
jgi:hypothetical protein